MSQRLLCTVAKQERMVQALELAKISDGMVVGEIAKSCSIEISPKLPVNLKVGAWVLHNGKSGRYQWKGEVISLNNQSLNRKVTVRWMLDRNNTRIEYTDQNYSDAWVKEGLKVFRLPSIEILSQPSHTDLSVDDEDLTKEESGQFIVWTKDRSSPNPNLIHTNREAAEAEAARLAKQFKKKFYVASLVSEAVHEITVTSKVIKL